MVDPGTGRREGQESPQAGGRRSCGGERLESLGQLAGGIAQDFDNLLAVILSCASFVCEDLAAPSGPDWPERLESARRDLGQITLAAQRAAGLTSRPLVLVRPQVPDLDHAAADVQEMLRRALGEHVELVTTLAADLWPALADPAQKALLGAIMTGAAGYLEAGARRRPRERRAAARVRPAAARPVRVPPGDGAAGGPRARGPGGGADPAGEAGP